MAEEEAGRPLGEDPHRIKAFDLLCPEATAHSNLMHTELGEDKSVDPDRHVPPEATAIEIDVEPGKKEAEPAADDTSHSEESDEEVLEESPCGRYFKRREQIRYRDVPGVEKAYLAMDAEDGVEVVWNEAQFSGTKKFKAQEDKLKNVFEALTLIDHPNIVKFHRFWTDSGSTGDKGDKAEPRVIFITEYMSSGSLKQFLRKTKKNLRKIQLQSWKRFCIQILSALNYLHSTCEPPIVHGNLTCDTIFIQHNGLVKIGSVAPDIIHRNVKTCRDNLRNLHFLAPELGDSAYIPGPPIDIYAFGMCALETAALEIVASADAAPQQPNASDASTTITEEMVGHTIDSLEDSLMQDFIRSCLKKNADERPTARELLFHPALFEVHSLKLLAAHMLVHSPANINETMTDEAILTHYGKDTIMATIQKLDGSCLEFKLSDFTVGEKLEKFMEDVKFGIYPITAFAPSQAVLPRTGAVTPEGVQESVKSLTPEPHDVESNMIVDHIGVLISPSVPADPESITVVFRLDDSMNRQLCCPLSRSDSPEVLATELLLHGFIAECDLPNMVQAMTQAFIQRAHETALYHGRGMSADHDAENALDLNQYMRLSPLKLLFQQPSEQGQLGPPVGVAPDVQPELQPQQDGSGSH